MSTQSLWFEAALLPAGWWQQVRINIRQGRIAGIETDVPPDGASERHAIALPGLPNVHSHAFQRAMAGLTETRRNSDGEPNSADFWSWRDLMYHFVDRLEPDDVEAIAALAYIEMLEAGFTRVGEFHYLHHAPDGGAYSNPAEMCERIGAAAAATGIGLTLLPVLYRHGGFGGVAPEAAQRRFITDLPQYLQLLSAAQRAVAALPDAVVGVAPHSLRAVDAETLQELVQVAARGPIHIHVAEQDAEVQDCIAWSGERPVEWLLNHAGVDARWCLVHATHLATAELEPLVRSGAVAGLCPITEANLGDGVFRAAEFLDLGGSVAIGSDSNVLVSAAEELRTLEYGQRLRHQARNVLAGDNGHSTGRYLFDAAVRGGSQALGCESAGLAVGASADLLSLNTLHSSLVARQRDALLDSWVFASSHGAIDCVWRAGRKVVVSGVHVNRAQIAATYRTRLQGLLV